MAFQVSPGVQVQEIDATNVIPAVSSSTGAYCGHFGWGPAEEVTTVSSGKGLVESFGEPANTDVAAEHFYPASNFLDYGIDLKVVRIATTSMVNATTTSGQSLLIKNLTHYRDNYNTGAASVGHYAARYAGALGNSLKTSVCGGAAAFAATTVTTTNGTTAIGGSSIEVTLGEKFIVGDIITAIGSDVTRYKISAITFDSGATGAATVTLAQDDDSTQGLAAAVSSSANISREWEFASLFNKAPGTSTYASTRSSAGVTDELHIVVIDEDGLLSGTPGTVLEKFEALSKASDAKDEFGTTNYYVTVIQNKSDYVYWMDHSNTMGSAGSAAAGVTFGTGTIPDSASFTNGADGNQPTTAQKILAWNTHFGSADNEDISLLISGTNQADNGSGTAVFTRAEATSYYNQLMNIAEDRKDCVVFFSPIKSDCVDSGVSGATNVKATADTLNGSSYATMSCNWLYQYDRYNDRYVYVPDNGSVAGLCARTDYTNDAWYSPAGYNRGQIFGVTKLAFNPTKADRDVLYKARVNPVVTFSGQGTILFGDKTLVANEASAFSRINVRRLFIVLEKAIATAAKFQLFEFNDSFTRANFRAAIEPFLRQVQGRRGIYDYQVICDETNNTSGVIDASQFVASIFIKPARAINFITLTFVASRSGVDFDEVYGQSGSAQEQVQ
ncbi:phage tail sheath subtilisin-like domain-containing protein [bacterium]|nr:phage tail sheath subtilisin-like domain-containing protein [bacterium]